MFLANFSLRRYRAEGNRSHPNFMNPAVLRHTGVINHPNPMITERVNTGSKPAPWAPWEDISTELESLHPCLKVPLVKTRHTNRGVVSRGDLRSRKIGRVHWDKSASTSWSSEDLGKEMRAQVEGHDGICDHAGVIWQQWEVSRQAWNPGVSSSWLQRKERKRQGCMGW